MRLAATGSAGLEAEPLFKPAVVLLDVELPDISGLDVCTSLANSSDAFILMVSAHSSENDVLKGLGLGADDYIRKPFNGNELVARVQSFLRRRERSRKSDQDGRLSDRRRDAGARLPHPRARRQERRPSPRSSSASCGIWRRTPASC